MTVLEAHERLEDALSVYFKLTRAYEGKAKAFRLDAVAAIDNAARDVVNAREELSKAQAAE